MTKRKIDGKHDGSTAEDFFIPESGIEDTDRGVFELFDKRLNFQVKIKDQASKVPVVFSTGERFALTRRRKPIRDKNNAIILPIIPIKIANNEFTELHAAVIETNPASGPRTM